MIDFNAVVNEVLLEAPVPAVPTTTTPAPSVPTTTTTPAPSGSPDDIDKQGIEGFIDTNYKTLQTAFTTKYGNDFIFASPEEVKLIAYTAMENCKRATKTSEPYPKFINIFPLLDLFGSLTKAYQKGSKLNDRTAITNAELSNFLKKLTDTKSKIPLDYNPTNPWAMSVKQQFLSGNKNAESIGSLRLDTLNQNLPFYWIILDLVSFYKKGKAVKLPSSYTGLLQIGDSFLTEILTKINSIISGTVLPKEEKLKNIYDAQLIQKLKDTSIAVYRLYQQQIGFHLSQDQIETMSKNEKAYAAFIGVFNRNGAIPFTWEQFRPPTTVTDSLFTSWCLDVINEIVSPTVDDINAAFDTAGQRARAGRDLEKFAKDVATYINKEVYPKDKRSMVTAIPKFLATINQMLGGAPDAVGDINGRSSRKLQPHAKPIADKIQTIYPKNKKAMIAAIPKFAETVNAALGISATTSPPAPETPGAPETPEASPTGSEEPTEENPKALVHFQEKPQEEGKPLELVYSLKNLRKAAMDNDPVSENLLKRLEDLANFIKADIKRDWTGLTDIAQGAMLGTKMMRSS